MKSRATKMTAIEQEIAARVKAAKTRLRFDKVVRQLSHNLKAVLGSFVPEGHSVILTVTAPIRRPSETAALLENHFCEGMPDRELRKTINGNQVRILPVTDVATYIPKVIVLVHNPESDPGSILAIAKSRLLERNRCSIDASEKSKTPGVDQIDKRHC